MDKDTKKIKKLIFLIMIAIIFYWVLNNTSIIGDIIGKIIDIIFPFILGACLAFILNIPMSFFEKKLKKIGNKKLKRIISLVLAIVVIIVILALIINLVVPELIKIIALLINNIPYYIEELNTLTQNMQGNITIDDIMAKANINAEQIKTQAQEMIPKILNSSILFVGNFFSGIAHFFIAIVFSVYILIDKEKLQKQAKKIMTVYLGKNKTRKIIKLGKVSNNTFRSFFVVQCLEATILGVLCIIGMLILRIPYAFPIGILIGVTSLIPVVGAFLGAIIGAILIVSINPIKVITFIIFVIILQQVEGNVIYPRVVGNSVGLPGMWVLVAVTIGGSLFGILGMLIAVPIGSIIYTLIKEDVNKQLQTQQKN